MTNTRVLALLLPVLFASSCGLSQEEIRQTQVPITQTAEWSAKDAYFRCLSNVLNDAFLLDDASDACESDKCLGGIAVKIEDLGNALPNTCSIPDPCATRVQTALQTHLSNMAYFVRGPGIGLNPYEQDVIMEDMFDRVRYSFESYFDTLNNSCLRR